MIIEGNKWGPAYAANLPGVFLEFTGYMEIAKGV